MKVIFGDLVPGETPIEDSTGLKVPDITTRQQLSRVEAENIRKVLTKYFGGDVLTRDTAPFDYSWALDLHREMYEDVWDWAGVFRLGDLNIGVPFGQIRDQLYNLFGDLEYWIQAGMDPEEQAARLHHRAVEIHPFPNGNGRWGRMLANLWLAVSGRPVVRWPEQFLGDVSPIRDAYIAALQAADNGDIGPLLELHRRHAESSTD